MNSHNLDESSDPLKYKLKTQMCKVSVVQRSAGILKPLCLNLQAVCNTQTPPHHTVLLKTVIYQQFLFPSCSQTIMTWSADSNNCLLLHSWLKRIVFLVYLFVIASFPRLLLGPSSWLLYTLTCLRVFLLLGCLSLLRDPVATCIFYTFLPMILSDIFRVRAQFVLRFAASFQEWLFVLR